MNNLSLVEVIDTPLDAMHRFPPVHYRGQLWDLSHLDSFAFSCEITPGHKIEVVVLFSCHCFTHSFKWELRQRHQVPNSEIYNNGIEERVLSPARYEHSLLLLRGMATELPKRRICIANSEQLNYMTWQLHNADGTQSIYAVFFDAERDTKRKGRVILRIQSGYVLDKGLTKRQKEAKKVSFSVLVKAAYEGRKIKP